jgi:glucose/arabinose dehydrogenase
MPDGRLLITDKSGFMQILEGNGKAGGYRVVKKITGFPEVVDQGQIGMLDVALDPGFSSNKTIYWSYAEKTKMETSWL